MEKSRDEQVNFLFSEIATCRAAIQYNEMQLRDITLDVQRRNEDLLDKIAFFQSLIGDARLCDLAKPLIVDSLDYLLKSADAVKPDPPRQGRINPMRGYFIKPPSPSIVSPLGERSSREPYGRSASTNELSGVKPLTDEDDEDEDDENGDTTYGIGDTPIDWSK